MSSANSAAVLDRSGRAAGIKVRATGGKYVSVVPGVLGDSATYLFSNGQCGALAMAISRRLDKPLKLLATKWHPDDNECLVDEHERFRDGVPFEWITDVAEHVVVEIGDDRYLDIRGVSNRDDLMEHWFEQSDWGALVAATEEQLLSIFTRPRQNVAVAERFVDAVLEKYLLGS